MTTVIKASSSADFLGLVPALAGFVPTRSVVLVPFEGKRTYGALRIDLPDDDPCEFADRAVELAARVRRTDGVAFVVYCDDPPQRTHDGIVLPYTVLAEELLGAAEEQGLRIVDALCITSDGWASYLEDDPVLHPLDTIDPAQRPARAEQIEADQSVGADLPEFGVFATESVARALMVMDRLSCPLSPDDEPMGTQTAAGLVLFEDIPSLFEMALELPDDPPALLCAPLIHLLDRPLYRDVALLQWASDLPGGEHALQAQLRHRDLGIPVADMGLVMLGEGPRPDPARLRAALRASRILAALAPRAQRVGPLTLAAWFAWALGRATHAARYLADVARIDPGYGLALLVNELMDVRPLPEWAFDARRDEAA